MYIHFLPQFNPALSVNKDIPGYVKEPKLDNRMHCVAFVVDAPGVSLMSPYMIQKFRDILTLAQNMGKNRINKVPRFMVVLSFV